MTGVPDHVRGAVPDARVHASDLLRRAGDWSAFALIGAPGSRSPPRPG
ncbi:hypothetical protein HBB16_18565 [Pseudonocardia sp. MCCB 268]|nr:hypothetical protein [Pseudonocardia cytotoxica]